MATWTKKYVDDAMAQPVDVMCGDLFDHIDDLLDFPNDDDVRGMDDYQCGPAPPAPAPAFTPLLPPLHADGLLGGDGGGGDSSDGSGDGARGAASAFHRGEEKLDPWDDLGIAEPEWLASFFDDNVSFTVDFPKCNTTTPAAAAASATTIGTNDSNNNSSNSKEDSLFRTSSPVSVLEPNSHSIGGSGGGGSSSSSSSSFSSSSSSCSGTGGGSSSARAREAPPISHPEPILVVPARARSKRPRPASFSCRPHVTIPFLPPSSDNIPAPTPVDSSSSSQSESFAESNPGPDTMKQKKTKKKSYAGTAAGGDEAPPVRKCMHCEIQKTPQWRAGPMGPKTLCNACGVRYKSGRLFPEYRPAASPTFVPSLHSNSHRKVVEMRLKASERATATRLPSPESASKDSCDLLAYIRRRE